MTLPTLALENTRDPAAPAIALQLAAPGGSPNRHIAGAGALSTMLHLALLLTIGIASREATKPSSAPELELSIELEDGRDTEHDRAGPLESSAAPAPKSTEELVAAVGGRRSSNLESPAAVAAPTVPPTQDDTPKAATPSDGPVQGDSAPVEAGVVTTFGVSDSDAAAPAEAGARAPRLAIAAPQQSMLTRWVMKAAQGLQDANLRQARLSLQHEGRQYIALLDRRPAADDMDIERVNVEIITEEHGRRLRTLLQMKRLAFSHFTQLVDRWDTTVQFHDDEIAGRFHSNSEILLGYDRLVAPRFLGKVTTAAGGFTIVNSRGRKAGDEIFRAGIETRAGRIALPAKFPPLAAHQADENANVQSFPRGTRITFYSDGSYGWREIGSNAPERRQALSAVDYILGARNTIICVRGTVRGKVLVYSPERIVIEGNLIYAHDPRAALNADDYLGLLSSKDVEIARQEVTGRGDLEIHAAIYAGRRFTVTDEDAPNTGTLLIVGSLSAGSLSPTEPRYATRYEFDRRFEQTRPPGFPVTDRYEVDAWDTQWRQVDDDRLGADAETVPPPAE